MCRCDDEAGPNAGLIQYCFPKIARLGSASPVVGLNIGQNLLADRVDPFMVTREKRLNEQIRVGPPMRGYFPFAGRDEWQAVKRLLGAPGVARVGFCESAMLIWPTRRFIQRLITIEELLGGIAFALDDLFDGEAISFEEDDLLFPCQDCGLCNRTFTAMYS